MTLSAADNVKSTKSPDQKNFIVKNDEVCYTGALGGLDLVLKQLDNYAPNSMIIPLGLVQQTVTGEIAANKSLAVATIEDRAVRGPATITGVDYLKDLLKPVYATDENTYTLTQSTGEAWPVGYVSKTYPSNYSTLATTKGDIQFYSEEHFVEKYMEEYTLPSRTIRKFDFPLPPAATQAVTTDLFWDLSGTSAAAAVLAGGGFTMTSNTTNPAGIIPCAAAIATGDYYATRNPDVLVRAGFTANTGGTFIGFTLTCAGDLTTDNDQVIFYHASGGANWYVTWSKGGVDGTPVDTGVAFSTTADMDFHVLITADGYGNFFINGEYVGITDATVTADAAFLPTVTVLGAAATVIQVRSIKVGTNHKV